MADSEERLNMPFPDRDRLRNPNPGLVESPLHRLVKKCGMSALTFLGRSRSFFDKYSLGSEVPLSNSVSHRNFPQYLSAFGNKQGMRVLEIGSREVTKDSHAREDFCHAEYVGFDFYPGRNVDVVGDVHRLTSYFSDENSFDLIFSSACFEHFAMPWVAATEIAKMLKIGGLVFIESHFSYSSHERPWHFFQFSDMAFKVLFSEALGFQCIEAGMSNPMIGRFSSLADKDMRFRPVRGLYCHTEYLGKKLRNVPDFKWSGTRLVDVVGDTKYPEPQAELSK